VVLGVATVAAAVVVLPRETADPGTGAARISTAPAPSDPATPAPTRRTQSTRAGTTLEPCPRSAAQRLTVLTLNIHSGRTKAGRVELGRLASELRSWDADLVLLQEVDRNTQRSGPTDQPAVLARLTGYPVAFGRTIGFQGGDYGIALLSRWPIRRDTLIPLTVTAPPGRTTEGREQRGVLLAMVDAPGGPLAVLNTHLDASGEDVWRAQEISGVLQAAATVDAHVPLIIGGDLNALPESPLHQRMGAAGFRDAWPECGTGDARTFPVNAPARRIDYLYLGGAVRCVDARVLADYSSDHRPLLVRIRLP
jgi:endonuclease/exonuclease/phosphatase family metal-dependent hydrolase